MIVDSKFERGKCCNCERDRGLIEYKLNKTEFDICENCACAMSNMFFKTMEIGGKQIYDEVTERIITNIEGEII